MDQLWASQNPCLFHQYLAALLMQALLEAGPALEDGGAGRRRLRGRRHGKLKGSFSFFAALGVLGSSLPLRHAQGACTQSANTV